MTRVVVVGAGIAGTAAALAARRAGADVTVVDGGTGASTLAPGALDDRPWADAGGHPELDEAARAVVDSLGIYAVPAAETPAIVLTTTGLVRRARARDAALLDLASLGAGWDERGDGGGGGGDGGVVVVPDVARAGWDAAALARAWGEAETARALGVTFAAIDAHLVRFSAEESANDAEMAGAHDDDDRLAWLGARLVEAIAAWRAGAGGGANVVGVALPPWLGARAPRAAALSRAVGVACGEAIGLPPPAAGLRFECARDRAFAEAGIAVVAARAAGVAHDGATWTVVLEARDDLADVPAHDAEVVRESDGPPARALRADAVVVATGGLVGGGLAYTPGSALPAREMPTGASPTIRTALDFGGKIGWNGRVAVAPGSLHGVAPEELAWPFARPAPIERAGVLVARDGAVIGAPPGIYAAGEVVADRPRTWLDALACGAIAGKNAVAGA